MWREDVPRKMDPRLSDKTGIRNAKSIFLRLCRLESFEQHEDGLKTYQGRVLLNLFSEFPKTSPHSADPQTKHCRIVLLSFPCHYGFFLEGCHYPLAKEKTSLWTGPG